MTKLKNNAEPVKALRRAVKLLGGQRAAARLLNCSQNRIGIAVRNKRLTGIDPKLAAELHDATNGAVKKWEMCPDVFKPRKPYTRKAA